MANVRTKYKRVPVVRRSKIKNIYKISGENMDAIDKNTWDRISQNEARRNAGLEAAGQYRSC